MAWLKAKELCEIKINTKKFSVDYTVQSFGSPSVDSVAGVARPQITLLVIEAAAAGTKVSWVGGKSRRIPVGSEAGRLVVPVGLVVASAVLLPVGAVAAATVAAATAALAFTKSPRVVSLPSAVEIWRGVKRSLPGVQVVP
jgi:hypothetical protein